MRRGTERLIPTLRSAACGLQGTTADFDALLGAVGDARLVLLGEASHGTHDFYRVRAEITKRLIREKGFSAVAVEADWPDAYRVNRYVRGRAGDPDSAEALGGFLRFPQWMWRNADVLDFVGWLREHNDSRDSEAFKVGFYGLDLYSLHASMHAVIEYLKVVDPDAAVRAADRYACFEHFGPQIGQSQVDRHGQVVASVRHHPIVRTGSDGIAPAQRRAVPAVELTVGSSKRISAPSPGRESIASPNRFARRRSRRCIVRRISRRLLSGRSAISPISSRRGRSHPSS